MSDPFTRALEPPADEVAAAYARTRRALRAVFAVVVLLLATNLGEFWPFSIYPMFSRAGRPFTRSIVRELDATDAIPAGALGYEQLPGRPFALIPHGLQQNDVANIASKTDTWTPQRVEALERLFATNTATRRLLLLSAHGELVEGRVRVVYKPLAELRAEGARMLQ
jgi:hypothetical protein